MLHSKKGSQAIAARNQVDGAAQGVIDACRIGHESDAAAGKRSIGEGDPVYAAEYMGFFHTEKSSLLVCLTECKMKRKNIKGAAVRPPPGNLMIEITGRALRSSH